MVEASLRAESHDAYPAISGRRKGSDCCCCSNCDYSHEDTVSTEAVIAAATHGDFHYIRHAVCTLGARIMECTDEDGMTALHVASQKGHLPVVRFLLDAVSGRMGSTECLNSYYDDVCNGSRTACAASHPFSSLLLPKQKSPDASFSSCISSPPQSSPSPAFESDAEGAHLLDVLTASFGGSDENQFPVLNARQGSSSTARPNIEENEKLLPRSSGASSTTGSTVSNSTGLDAAAAAAAVSAAASVAVHPAVVFSGTAVATPLKCSAAPAAGIPSAVRSPWSTKTSRRGHTSLHWAAVKGHVAVVAELINFGFDVNATSLQGASPLQLAVVAKKADVIRLLVKHGANVHAQTISGSCPEKAAAHLSDPVLRAALRFC